MNVPTSKISDQNHKAQLASQFNQFYLQITSPNISQIGNYRIIEEIGEGAFGKVYLAVHVLLNVKVVLKCGPADDPNIVREIYYHRQLKHKNIVNLYEVIKTENHLWIVLEYCEGSELFFYIYEKKRLDITECQQLFFQIVLGLKHVHSLNLSHRDLKLENILLADRKKTIVKLTDFGFVREFNPQSRKFLSTVCGTAVYMAPELLRNEKYSGFAIDIWSLGVILFTMLYGEMPFDEEDDMMTKYKIIHEEPVYKNTVPTEFKDLARKMLSKDPSKRPDLNEILNSSFLVDLYNKHLEKTSNHTYNDAESVLSINQHYHVTNSPFQTKIEKVLLRRLNKLDVNIEELQNNVYNNEMNSLTAFYELLLTKEFSKKKRRYYKEKKKKYYEAKKTLLKSRNRVKSALSLTDVSPSMGASQPLEKIKSTLSINSHRNSSIPNLYRLGSDSRKSVDIEQKRIDSQSSRNSFYSKANIANESSSQSIFKAQSSAQSSPKVQTKSAQPVVPVREVSTTPVLAALNDSPNFNRVVSFYPETSSRRSSIAPSASTFSTNDTVKKRSRNGQLFNKLKFWKKDNKDKATTDDDMEEPLSNLSLRENSNSKVSTEHSTSLTLLDNEVDFDSPLEIKVKRKSPNLHQEKVEPREDIPGSDKEKGLDMTPTSTFNKGNLKNDKILIDDRALINSPTIIDASSRSNRPRPTSMISQLSQISHLSQMSTMISESELDILDGTDTMDEDYDDEDGLYESSLNASQDFTKSVQVTPTNMYSSSKKRPSYKRALSSDMSSLTSSTMNKASKRLSLSQLSSASSDESSIKSTNNFNSPLPYNNSDQSPKIGRPDSPDLLKNKKRFKHPIFSNSNYSNSEGNYAQSASFTLMDNGPFIRSPSPPVSKKLNKMNQRLMKPVRTVFEQRSSSSSEKGNGQGSLSASSFLPSSSSSSSSKSKSKRHIISNPISVTPNPPNWKMDWNNPNAMNIGINNNNAVSVQKGYAPVINEEEENEE